MAASDTELARALGRNLRRLRMAAGLSQEELGFRAGLHRTGVGQLERGERIARASTVIKLAGVLGCSPGELLEGVEWEPVVFTSGGFQLRSPGHAGSHGENES